MLNSYFLLCYSLVCLMKASSTVSQSYILRGFVSQGQVLKIRVPDVGFKPFSHLKAALGFELPPD